MYVLEVSGSGNITYNGNIYKGGNQRALFPADRCTFQTAFSDSKNAYEVTNVHFFPGGQVPGSSPASLSIGLSGANLEVRLGYIGKSGRFVGITD